MKRAGIRALALGFPSIRRTNDFWRRLRPEMVEKAEQYSLANVWAAATDGNDTVFDRVMDPYLADPFRGSVERRLRAPEETALSMELTAARGAIAAAGLAAEQIDLTLVSSFMGDRLGVGNAAHLAAALGLRRPAWNFESACSGAVVGFDLAASLVRSGDYGRILVVVSTSNSRQVTEDDTVGWFVGDGAGAFVVDAVEGGHGVLGSYVTPSVLTNDMFVIRAVQHGEDGVRFVTRGNPRTASVARHTAEPYLVDAVRGALASARLALADVDFWIFNTPTAWYADFCGQQLGIDASRYTSVYDRYANIGAALMPATLYHAIVENKVKPGDVVGLYSIGSTSTAACVILRVGEIALGPFPAPPVIPDPDATTDGRTATRPDVRNAPIPVRRRARSSNAELAALLQAIWPDGAPDAVRVALAQVDALDAEALGRTWRIEHRIEVSGGLMLPVIERASLLALLASPRRGALLLPGPLSRASSFEIDVDGYRFHSWLASRGYITFAVDPAGVPGSAQPPDGSLLDHATTVAQMRALIDRLRQLRWLPPVDVIGESTGGAVAAELASDEERVRSVVLVAMLYAKGSSMFQDVFMDPAFLEQLRSSPGGYLDASAEYYGNILAHAPPAVSQRMLSTQPGRYAIAPLLAPTRLPWYDVDGARVPALIVQGEHDNVAPPSDAGALAAAYGRSGGGRAEVIRIEGAGHIPRLDRPELAERFREAVLAFLEAR